MSTHDNRSIVERYAQALPSDFATLASQNYPGGLPDLKPKRIVGSEDRWVVTPSYTPLRIMGTGDIYVIQSEGA
ncbi:MAG: hypothetical protein E6I87_14405 [Chloroflexi bacterium]|nr:MAG: hypothetical protein E6I87_14405 [Chloroflexota bacterium]